MRTVQFNYEGVVKFSHTPFNSILHLRTLLVYNKFIDTNKDKSAPKGGVAYLMRVSLIRT